MSTSMSPSVGRPVRRPCPGRDVRRKWWPAMPSGVDGAVKPSPTSYTPSNENSGSLRGRSVRSRHAFSHHVARATLPPASTSPTRVAAYSSPGVSHISRYRNGVSRSSTALILRGRFRSETEERARVVACHTANRAFVETLGQQRVGEVLEARSGTHVRLLPVVGGQGAPFGADRADGACDHARGPGCERAETGERAQFDRGTEVGELGALLDGEVGSRQLFHRVRDEHLAAPAERLCHLEVLGPGHVPRGENSVVLCDEVEHRVRLGRQRTVVVDDGQSGTRDAQLLADPV